MADIIENPEFWLPSHFITEDDRLIMDKENFHKYGGVDSVLKPNNNINFSSSEFPYYGFDSSLGSSPSLNSPVESSVGSAETESDEEDLFAELTRHLARSTLHEPHKIAPLEKTWGVLSGSPQSTLSVLRGWSGSPNGPSQKSSSPTTPLGCNNDPWDVIYAAAGRVARLKMDGGGPNKYSHYYQQNRDLFGSSGDLSSLPVKKTASGIYSNHQILTHKMSQTNQFENLRHGHGMKQQNSSIWGNQAAMEEGKLFQRNQLAHHQMRIQNRGKFSVGYENERCGGRPLGFPETAWPPLQLQQHQQLQQQNRPGYGSGIRTVIMGSGGGASNGRKRESIGTGVFLPRRYGSLSESRKKQPGSGCSTVLLPARVVQALNLKIEDINSPSQSRFRNGSVPDFDVLMAQRNALVFEQHKRSLRSDSVLNSEIRLPQEWTY